MVPQVQVPWVTIIIIQVWTHDQKNPTANQSALGHEQGSLGFASVARKTCSNYGGEKPARGDS